MNEATVALVAALGAAFLTAAASLGVVWYQENRRDQAADADALAAAVSEVLSRSIAVALRLRFLADAARFRSGLGEGLDVLLRIRKPADVLEFHDWLYTDLAPLNAAWSEIWARGDQELVASANALLQSVTNVLSVAARLSGDGMWARVRRAVVGERWTREQRQQIEDAQAAMARRRKDLTIVARRKLGRSLVDPFAEPLAAPDA